MPAAKLNVHDRPGVVFLLLLACAAVARVLREPAYRSAAERICGSIHSGGGAGRAAEIVEESLALETGQREPMTVLNCCNARQTGDYRARLSTESVANVLAANR